MRIPSSIVKVAAGGALAAGLFAGGYGLASAATTVASTGATTAAVQPQVVRLQATSKTPTTTGPCAKAASGSSGSTSTTSLG